MALIAWWPLNGDLKDYSGNNLNLTSSACTLDNVGKIGKTYLWGTNGYLSTNNLTIGQTSTVCAWGYLTQGSGNQMLFSFSEGNGPNLYFTETKVCWNSGDGSTNSFPYTRPAINKWYHFAVVNDAVKNKSYLYVNGQKIGEAQYRDQAQFNSKFVIGNYGTGTSYSWMGKINDVRIYDNALSVKEIKEIAKAKILHYNCNVPEQYYKNLITNGNFRGGLKITGENGSYGTNTIVKVTNPGTSEYALRQLASGREYEIRLNDYTGCTAGTYILSCWVGTTSNWNGGTTLTHCRFFNNGTVIGTLGGGSYTVKETRIIGDVTWRLIYEKINVTNTVTEFQWYLGYGGHNDANPLGYRYITDIQLIKGNDYLPFVYKTNNLKIMDCSGFRNNSVTNSINTPVWTEDSATGSGSYKFDGSAKMSNGSYQHFISENKILVPEEGTMSFFIKHQGVENGDNKYAVGFENFCSMNNNNLLGLIYYHTSSEYTNKTANYQLRDNQWHQYAISWSTKNNTLCLYADGKKISAQQPGTMAHVNTFRSFLVGNAWGTAYGGHSGGLDDIRLYATQLSDNDILDIYKCKGAISKNGKLYVNEIKEIPDNSLILPSDVVVSNLTTTGVSLGDADSNGIRILRNADSAGSFRFNFPLTALTPHINKPLTFSFKYKNVSGGGLNFTDWCDGSVIKSINNGKIMGQGTRAEYTSVFRFMDCDIAANSEIHIWDIKLEQKAIKDYSSTVTSNSQLLVEEINEIDTLSFKTKTEFGVNWVRLFYHNNKSATVLFGSNKSEFLKCNTGDKISDLWALEQFRGNDGKFELLLQYQSQGSLYNRWKQSSNFTKESIKGYEAINCSWTTSYWGGLELSNTSSTWVDGSVNHGNWYYAIGARAVYSGGIPGPANAETGWVEVWVRCDNPEMFKMYKNGIVKSTEFIEV